MVLFFELRKMGRSIDTELHNRDFNLWLEQMAIAIKNRDTKNMDWEGLLEEIEDMTASQKRALRSYTKRLIEHILKLQYWHSEKVYNQKHWRKEVVNFRDSINEILQDSPSLRNYLQENYQSWFKKSVKGMRQEINISEDNFIPLEDIMEENFFG